MVLTRPKNRINSIRSGPAQQMGGKTKPLSRDCFVGRLAKPARIKNPPFAAAGFGVRLTPQFIASTERKTR